MNYIAIFLDEKGRALSNNNTGDYINIQLGDFDNIHQATECANNLFDGYEVKEGVIWSKSCFGGVLITTNVHKSNSFY